MKRLKTEFYEKQYMRQWWMWTLFLSIIVLFGYGFYQQMIMGRPFGENPMSDTMLIVANILVVAVALITMFVPLTTVINVEGVQLRFFPFMLKTKVIFWDEIERLEIRKYSPIKEFGGWGYRGLGRKRGLVVRGNIGLNISLKTGKKLLVSTRQVDEMRECLNHLGQDFVDRL